MTADASRSSTRATDRLLDVDELSIRRCGWCPSLIPEGTRRDSIYCSKSCRQAAHRFRRGYTARPAPARPLRLAYADPPYPELAARHYRDHRDYAGEVDHRELVRQLAETFPDGWALSTNSRSLARILQLDVMPADVQVGAWTRGARPTRAALPLQAWEPVIYRGGRQEVGEETSTRLDALVYTARIRSTDQEWVTGAKPAEFLWWMFDLLGCGPDQDDEQPLDDEADPYDPDQAEIPY